MAWYRTGSISVTANSATVTGAGTAWVANVRVGDGLQGPDGRTYEITNIASNAALSIAPAYRGATASGQAYWIIPIQGHTKLLADRAAGLIGDYGTAKDLAESAVQPDDLGTAASLNVLAGQTGFGNASAATLMVTASDVTAGRVLTTGGGGILGISPTVTNENMGVLADIVGGSFYSGSTVGGPSGAKSGLIPARARRGNYTHQLYQPLTVASASLFHQLIYGGVVQPWREIFDTGNCTVTENTGGTSVRFPNRLQICFGNATFNLDMTLAEGSIFRTAAGQSFNFAQTFATVPAAFITPITDISTETRILCPVINTNLNATGTRSMSAISRVLSSVRLGYIAIGKW
ncbi:MAG: hypothetical protein ABN482_01575 [Corticimicrobacter sp.]|uniref:hypothetical protein n=1 Tax=Corticimicrobacter sp. TaxID=2678536 RepID=UPI0032DB5CDB